MSKDSHVLKELYAGERRLVIRGGLRQPNRKAILELDYDVLELGDGDWRDLSWLREQNSVRALKVSDDCDWSTIAEMTELRYLDVGGYFKGKNVSFEKLQKLRSFSGDWNKWFDGSIFFLPKLKYLSIHGYKGSDLSEIKNAKNLEGLGLVEARVMTSLRGIEELVKLREVGLAYLRSLVDAHHVQALPKLENLHINKCKRVDSFNFLSSCLKLVELFIEDSGEIESLSILEKLENLDTLRLGSTLVVDGDLRAALSFPKLKYFYYANKKTYNLKAAEKDKLMTEKWGEIDWSKRPWESPWANSGWG